MVPGLEELKRGVLSDLGCRRQLCNLQAYRRLLGKKAGQLGSS